MESRVSGRGYGAVVAGVVVLRWRRHFVGAIAVGVAFGCTNTTEQLSPVCPSVGGIPALAVIVRDAKSGARSPFYGVKVVARNSAYVDSAMRDSILSEAVQPHRSAIQLLAGHPGLYDLTVTASGYQATQTKVLTVKNSQCGALTDTIVVPLQR